MKIFLYALSAIASLYAIFKIAASVELLKSIKEKIDLIRDDFDWNVFAILAIELAVSMIILAIVLLPYGMNVPISLLLWMHVRYDDLYSYYERKREWKARRDIGLPDAPGGEKWDD